MKKTFCLIGFLFLIIFNYTLFGQDCYVRLPDATGVDMGSYNSELETAACSLIDSFPIEYQDSFKVYDFGFYLYNGDMPGGVSEVFEKYALEVRNSNKYYLIFGRQTGLAGNLEKVWISVNLPTEGIFSCFSRPEVALLQTRIEVIANRKKGIFEVGLDNEGVIEKKGILELIDFIKEAKQCCPPEARLNRDENTCVQCSTDVDFIRAYMELNGFVGIKLQELLIDTKFDTTGYFEEFSQISITTNEGESINVNEDLDSFIEGLSQRLEGVFGSIYFYQQDQYCRDIINIIGNSELSLPLALKSNIKARNTPYYFINLSVIATIGLDGRKMIHVRIKDNLPNIGPSPIPGWDSGTIYMIKLNNPVNSSISMTVIEEELEAFYNLIMPDKRPNVAISTYLRPTELYSLDAICLIGKKSRIIEYTRENLKLFYEPIEEYTMESFMSDELNPEVAIPKFICFVEVNYMVGNKAKWRCSTTEKGIAFLAFHGLGHLAGFVHKPRPAKTARDLFDFAGFVENGPAIVMQLGISVPKEFSYAGWTSYSGPYLTIEALINGTPKYVIDGVKKRFIIE